MDLKELLSGIATGEQKDLTAEDIKNVTDEYNNLVSSKGNDEKIKELENQLEEEKKKHEELKNRIVEKLFVNPTGKPDDNSSNKDDEDEKDTKKDISFKDIINPIYQQK